MSPDDALHAARRASPRDADPRARVLVAGGAGALGAAVLEAVLASGAFAQVAVAVTQPLGVALRGLATVSEAALSQPPAHGRHEAIALVVFDRERRANGREAAFLRPQPAALGALAARLQARGVRHLVVVMPHTQATLPDALKHGLATLDEQAVAALGFEHVVIVRSAHAPARERAASAPQRLADWVLSQLHLMVPPREQPVRAADVARFVVELARHLSGTPAATRVVAPETVWEAAHAPELAPWVARALR